jgi:hypothetical protein
VAQSVVFSLSVRPNKEATMKKTWESPKLIVLVRVRPEESILGACKSLNGPIPGPNDDYYFCGDEYCALCNATADS